MLAYRAVPRAVDEHTRNGPLFDLREEAGGLNGAGFTFLAPPVAEGALRDPAALGHVRICPLTCAVSGAFWASCDVTVVQTGGGTRDHVLTMRDR